MIEFISKKFKYLGNVIKFKFKFEILFALLGLIVFLRDLFSFLF